MRHDVLRSHPGLVTELPYMQEQHIGRDLSTEDVRKLLDAARDHRQFAVIAVIATLGLRHGEALGLQWDDLMWDAREGIGTLSVIRTVVTRDNVPTISYPKTKASARPVLRRRPLEGPHEATA